MLLLEEEEALEIWVEMEVLGFLVEVIGETLRTDMFFGIK